MRRICSFLLCIFLLFSSCHALEEKENPVSLRSLLVACDYFLSQPATYPAGDSNVSMMEQALLRDLRGYETIDRYSGNISSVEALEKAVLKAFGDADDNDISLFYISTHGSYNDGKKLSDAALLLSDGEKEEKLTAAKLKEILDGIKGKKILILDACNSGAFIGKGLEIPRQGKAPLMDQNYYVLCSAGGSEESWYWKSSDDGDPNIQYGASYFADVLTGALSAGSAADTNGDGTVTLREIYRYLNEHYAASTPQVYPQISDFPLFEYDLSLPPEEKMISGLVFDDYVMMPGQKNIHFSFTLHQEAKVYYQLIYRKNGAWDFDNAQMISDSAVSGNISPGRKERTLTLETEKLDTAGYVMMLILTKQDYKTVVQATRLLCVQPAEGDMTLSVMTGKSFVPSEGEEMNIVVRHSVPCSLYVTVLDEKGNTVKRIVSGIPSRPQAFRGSTFCWNGAGKNDEPAQPGTYTVEIVARTGREKQKIVSSPFTLLGEKMLE